MNQTLGQSNPNLYDPFEPAYRTQQVCLQYPKQSRIMTQHNQSSNVFSENNPAFLECIFKSFVNAKASSEEKN